MSSARESILGALKVLPDDAAMTIPVPTLRLILSDSGDGNLLTVEDVARLTKRSPGAVRAWIRQGRLKAAVVGRRYLIERGQFDEFLNDERSSSKQPAGLTQRERMLGIDAWRVAKVGAR